MKVAVPPANLRSASSEVGTMHSRIEAPSYPCLEMGPRILLGPGPSTVHPRVLQAMAAPVVGHLDPDFLQVMDRIQDMLRYVFQTQNALTIPVSGTGSAPPPGGGGRPGE